MRVPVPRQASTTWWVILAALAAAVCTGWQHRALLAALAAPPRPAPPAAGTPELGAPEGDLVEFEIAP